MSVSKEDVINCYRYILGREPESQTIIDEHWMSARYEGLGNLRKRFLESGEFFESYQKQIKKEIKKLVEYIDLSSDMGMIKTESRSSNVQLIAKFDEGYDTIAMVDDQGIFQGAICRIVFSRNLSSSQRPAFFTKYVSYQEDEAMLKVSVAEAVFGSAWADVPVLRDQKPSFMGCRRSVPVKTWKWLNKFSILRWELISDAVIKEFFPEHAKVMISSSSGSLSGFVDKFSFWLDISVYDEAVEWRKIEKDYDYFIYGAELWSFLQVTKFQVKELFADLLHFSVVRWLSDHGISYHYFDTKSSVEFLAERLQKGKIRYLDYRLQPRESEIDYFVISRGTVEDELEYSPNICSGHRVTMGVNADSASGIYFFGGCLVTGGTTDRADETIESYLQKNLNKHGYNYHVFSCGKRAFSTSRTDHFLNNLYHIMDTKFSKGDIVLLFNYGKQKVENYHLLESFFSGRKDKIFVDTIGIDHMSPIGHQMTANFIYDLIKADLRKEHLDQAKFFQYYLSKSFSSESNDENLNFFLEKLPNILWNKRRIGSIVLKADPFTIAHRALIEFAIQKCDFLYVFVVESDGTMLSLEQRMNILSGSINDLDRICIIPAVKYSKNTIMWDGMRQTTVERTLLNFIPVNDAYIFSRWIAPRLNISIRFSGRETYDEAARQCTLLMKDFLRNEGIEWVILPRVKFPDGREINTCDVREMIQNRDWKHCREYMPEVAFSYLKNVL